MMDQIRNDCYYIFVNLNADKMGMPDYYICTSAEAKEKMKQYETRGIINLSSINTEVFKNNWLKLEN
jgi:hypothetical protein